MADTQDATAQAAATSAPLAGEGGTGAAQAPATDTATPAAATGQTVEELRAQLEREQKDRKEANAEAAKMRQRLKQLEEAETARTQAAMTEAERTAAALKEAQEKLKAMEADRAAMLITSAIVTAASAAGIRDPQDAVKLIDAAEIKYGDDGRPTNVGDLVKALVAAKPYLTGVGATSPANAGKGGATPDREAEIRQRLYGSGGDATFDPSLGGGVFLRPGTDK